MLRNNIKNACRGLKNQRFYSFIKIGGFAFSMSIFLLIVLYVKHEFSYDSFYPDINQVFRLVGTISKDNKIQRGLSMPAPVAPVLKDEFPEIELSARLLTNPLFGAGSNLLNISGSSDLYREDGFCYADQALLEIFPTKTIYGSLSHALDAPKTLVITKNKADKLFVGNPIGKIIYLNNDKANSYTITAVIEDIPINSNLYGLDFFMTLNGHEPYPGEKQNWLASNYTTYLKVKNDSDIAALQQKITHSYIHDYYKPAMVQAGLVVNEEIWKSAKLTLQPSQDIHLYSKDIRSNRLEGQYNGDIRLTYIYGGIALFILVIAIINFINLSTANAASRAKEVGIRKTIGSDRKTLIVQFITEAVLYSTISVFLALGFAVFLLPVFNDISGNRLIFPWFEWYFIPGLLVFSLIVGFIAGIYPAMSLSRFRPITVLKGNHVLKSSNSFFRNGLVVFQFATSIILIIGALVINQQMKYILNKDLGFDKEQVLVLRGTSTLEGRQRILKDELKKIATVSAVSIGDYLPVSMDGVRRNGNQYWVDGKRNEEAGVSGQNWIVDSDYLATFGIELVEGRNFNMEIPSDSSAIVINQKMVKDLNLKNPIGAKINNYATYTVIGVIKDFIFDNLRGEGVKPLALVIGGSPNMISIKLNSKNMDRSIADITKVWNRFSPHQKIDYTFLDEGFARLYIDVQRTQSIVSTFAGLAVFIACLGLFGLASFVTQQRTKEIGIRKVLGASIFSIIRLLSIEFIKPILISILIAIPIGWWAMNRWLEDFSYRIEVEKWIFVVAGVSSILIAFTTVYYQVRRVARINPVSSLKDE